MKPRWENDGSALNVGYVPDHTTGELTVVHSQDINPIVQNNQLRRSTEDNSKRRRSGEFFQIAEIPLGIVMRWKTLHGVDIDDPNDWPAVMQLIQSREYNQTVAVTDGNYTKAPVRKHFTGAGTRASHPLGVGSGRGGLVKQGIF